MIILERIKSIRWDIIAGAAIYAVFGVILVIYPGAVTEMMAYALAIGFFALAVICFYNYFNRTALEATFRNDLVIGIGALVLGVIAIAKKGEIINFIPLILGIVIIVSGVKKLQDAINMIRLKVNGWLTVAILAVVATAFGIVMVCLADEAKNAIIRVIGIGLIFSGLSDAFSAIWFSSKAKASFPDKETSDLVEVNDEDEK